MKFITILAISATSCLFTLSANAAVVSFSPAAPSDTDVDWSDGTAPSIQKFFAGDLGENLSLRMDFTAGGSSTGLRNDGSGGARGWQPNGGGTGVQDYRWTNGEIAYWTVTILDRDNGNADVTSSYYVDLATMQTTNAAAIPDAATIILTNGVSQTNTAQALASGGEVTRTFSDFDGKSMTLTMTNNPANAPHYFRIDTLSFEVTAVPEPSSVVLFGLGSLTLILRRRK
ncbi:hypothetical protein NT6N_29350 [Oceaniferula spumae]|uniref:Ice-binding protein C-terminal domain-containing protein n=1 Tax=Oceaniferula spumae TaxID=2979115 RepID=A0AAT9FPN0_9BACT